MTTMTINELADVLAAKKVAAKAADFDQPITTWSTDTRSLKKGNFFVALRGEHFDGQLYVANAQEKGALAAMVTEEVPVALPQIVVPDTRIALGQWAAEHRRRHPDVTRIAVTGSCGKTTTKEMIASILRQKTSVLANQGTYNNDIGVPLTLLQMTQEHTHAVLEVGADHFGEIDILARLVRPHVALITLAAPVHIAGFGDVAGVARGKGELLGLLPEHGTAVLNSDDDFYDYWRSLCPGRKIIRFGLGDAADVTARDITVGTEGRTQFTLCLPGCAGITVQLRLLGLHQVMNALAAAAVCLTQGIAGMDIARGLEASQAVAMRLTRRKGVSDATVIDDSYNANPTSLEAALSVLATQRGEKVLVFADMAELGEQSKVHHQRVGQRARELGIDKVYTVGAASRFTAEAFGDEGHYFADTQALITAVKRSMHADAIVLVKGSRCNHLEQVVSAIVAQE